MENASSSYRIGFLNPWKEKAENQAFHSLRIAGQRVGQELVHVTNSDEIIANNLDFVLAVHPLQPKTTDVPTFGVIHSPRALLLDYAFYGQTLPTYDGYLTIMDTIDQFLRALCADIGKPAHIGFYYNSPQRQFLGCNVEKLAELNALRVCYFGTNWDRRARPLFRVLANRPYMRIYGPEGAWDYLNCSGYHGSVPFDGQSVQRVYASFGAGLVVLSKDHVLDDVISNRIFEIASVGAVAICPDMPWLRKHFGDTVLYYNPYRSAATIASEIDALVDEIASDPRKASERAREARIIFEKKFSAEVLIQNAVQYFEEWRERSGKPTDPANDPLIDVIVRVGGRPISTVSRLNKPGNLGNVGLSRSVMAGSAHMGYRFPLPFKSLRIISGGKEGLYVIGAMFTAPYSNKAERLAASCEKFGLPYAIHEVPTVHRSISYRGTDDLCYTKANFIRHLLAVHKKPVLYLDADCEFVSQPDLIDDLMRSGCDFAIHNGCAEEYTDRYEPIQLSLRADEPPIRNRFYRCTGYLGLYSNSQLMCCGLVQFYANTIAARALLSRWHRTIAAFPGRADDPCLDFVFNNLTRREWLSWLLKVRWLPKSYARISWWIYAKPVINHADRPGGQTARAHSIEDSRGRKRHYPSLMKRTDALLFPRGCIIDTAENMVCKLVDGQLVPIEPTDVNFWL